MKNCIKAIKKINILIVVLGLIINCNLFAAVSNSTNTAGNNSRLDAVLVIDASGSMQETDPNKLGLEGVKLFLDMMSNSGNQAGIVTYGSQTDQIYPMTQIKTQSDRENMKNFVNGIQRNLEYTDITSGIGKAISMLDNRDKSVGGSPVIIVFTDGNNAIGGVKNRTKADIENDLNKEIVEAQSSGYPIYTIGLNDNGKLNEQYLKSISEQTGGLAFATKDPDELPGILTQIFAAYSNLKVQSIPTIVSNGDYEEVIVDIPNDNVLEANIAATSNNPVSFKLKVPNGNEAAIPGGQVTLHQANSYHLLKIAQPIKGKWKLYVKGTSGDRINISLVYNYDIDVVMEPFKQTQFSKGDMLDVSAYLSLQGQAVNDDELYKKAEASIVLEDENGNESKTKMSVSGQSFAGNCKLKESGSYKVSVLVEDSSYTRQSQKETIVVQKSAAGSNNNTSLNKQSKADTQNNSKLPLIIAAIIILAAAAFIIIKQIINGNRPLAGQMVVEIRDNTTGKLTPPQYKKLNVFKGKVSLHALLQYAPEYKAAENIIFKSAPGDKVILFNNSEYNVEKAGRALKLDKGLQIQKGNKFTINMADCGVTIQLEYLL